MKTIVLMVALLATAGVLFAADLVDRIAAVVNDDIILLSEVDEKLFVLQAQGQLSGLDSTRVMEVRREILDRLIEEKLVVQRATSQGVEVDPRELTERVDAALTQVRDRFPSLEAYRATLAEEGLTEAMLRERYENDVTQEILGQRIVGREVRGEVAVTTEDVQAYFEQNQDELPTKPDEVELAHIVAYPVSEEAERVARDRVVKARSRVEGGESFEDVAKDVSDDPSARSSRPGYLGTFGPGDLDPDFEAAVDSLELGELSEPVRTRFGFHLIEVLGRDGARFEVRHVLAIVDVKESDIERARNKMEKAWGRLRAGETFETVAAELSEDPLTKDSGGNLGWTPIQLLLPNVAAIVDTLAVNSVSGVVESDRGFHLFKANNRRSGGEYTFDEIQEQLRRVLENEKLEEAYDGWLAGIRDSAYVEIKNWESR